MSDVDGLLVRRGGRADRKLEAAVCVRIMLLKHSL